MSRMKKIGPGAVVAAAFIGPGTITSASFAGSSYGFTLAWAVLFSTFATFILQEMAMRLGIIGQKGLGEAMRYKISHPLLKSIVILIIISAIVIGNAAYEAGNISGAALGFEVNLIPIYGFTLNPMVLGIGLLAGLILLLGDARFITKFLMACVGVMGFVFIVSAIALKPDMRELIKSMFSPQIPKGSLKLVLALIGTTVVPYNLFLHASVSKNNWNEASDLPFARKDALISIFLGGLITLSILIAAALVKTQTGASIESLPQMAKNISPVLGDWSAQFMALGFLAAGLSSAITAPMAAALVACELFGWSKDRSKIGYRSIWLLIITLGIVFSSLGFKPTAIIIFAQFANGLLLPIIAGFLLWVVNDHGLLKKNTNSTFENLCGILVIIVAMILGVKSIFYLFN
ncbi:MAG TPA: Nramp family divalent metal transporter [Saprospiraceae bacterium]|nr:Nramp family divalent metal transporter [Saprospiraceae bacterium]